MKEGSPVHEELKSIVLNKTLLKDMELLNLNVFTTHLGVFHALKIRYLPKSIFFEQEKMETGMMMAAMDHNINIDHSPMLHQKQSRERKLFVRKSQNPVAQIVKRAAELENFAMADLDTK